MGLLGDFTDDLFNLPGKVVRGTINMSADLLAETLCLPITIVNAAIKAGCKTKEEIQDFADEHM